MYLDRIVGEWSFWERLGFVAFLFFLGIFLVSRILSRRPSKNVELDEDAEPLYSERDVMGLPKSGADPSWLSEDGSLPAPSIWVILFVVLLIYILIHFPISL